MTTASTTNAASTVADLGAIAARSARQPRPEERRDDAFARALEEQRRAESRPQEIRRAEPDAPRAERSRDDRPEPEARSASDRSAAPAGQVRRDKAEAADEANPRDHRKTVGDAGEGAKAVDAKATDAKNADAKAADAKGDDNKSAGATTVDAKSADAINVDTKGPDIKTDEAVAAVPASVSTPTSIAPAVVTAEFLAVLAQGTPAPAADATPDAATADAPNAEDGVQPATPTAVPEAAQATAASFGVAATGDSGAPTEAADTSVAALTTKTSKAEAAGAAEPSNKDAEGENAGNSGAADGEATVDAAAKGDQAAKTSEKAEKPAAAAHHHAAAPAKDAPAAPAPEAPKSPAALLTAASAAPAADAIVAKAQQPLQGLLHAAARAEAPVPLAAMAVEIGMRAMRGAKEFAIRLDPEDLGRVDVKLEISEAGQVQARVTVEKVETLQLLQRDARTLERAFDQAGLKTSPDGLQFSLRDPGGDGRNGGQAGEKAGGSDRGRQGAKDEPEAIDEIRLRPALYRQAAAGGLDIRI